MQMKQKLSAVFMVLCVPYLLLTACDTKEQKEQNAKWEEQASFNAQAYIKQKYGFAAEVTEATVDRRQGWISSQPLSDVFVEMRHDNRDFTVFITGEENSVDGADTYQAEEIRQAVWDTINADVPGLREMDIYAVRKSERRGQSDTPLYEKRFDGSNLTEVLQGSVFSVNCYYPESDFSSRKQFMHLQQLLGMESGVRAVFYSCRGETVFAQETRAERNWTASHAVYCTAQRNLAYTTPEAGLCKAEYIAYALKKYGEFYYSVSYSERQKEREAPKIQEVTPVDALCFDGYGVRDAVLASKAYEITADVPLFVHIYYPCSKIENFDYDGYMHSKTKIAMSSMRDGEPRYHADSIETVGDYAYEKIELQAGVPVTLEFLYDPK